MNPHGTPQYEKHSEDRRIAFMDLILVHHGCYPVPFSLERWFNWWPACWSNSNLHADSDHGFILNACIHFKSRKTIGDYHSNIDYKKL